MFEEHPLLITIVITLLYTPRSHHRSCVLQRIITGAKASPDDIAMGVDVESTNMLDHVEFDAPQTSDLAETMTKRLLEEITNDTDTVRWEQYLTNIKNDKLRTIRNSITPK